MKHHMTHTTFGTAHFVTLRHAASYYRAYFGPYGMALQAAREKLAAGEIHIGPPIVRPGETLVLLDGETRYGIREAS
jgi:hypothetical protein